MHEAKSTSDLALQIRESLGKLEDRQRGPANQAAVRLFTREIDIKAYLEESVSTDSLPVCLRYLYMFLLRFPDMQEISTENSQYISTILCNTWTVFSSKTDDSVLDDRLILFVLKCAELMYRWETFIEGANNVRVRRKSILCDFDWSNVHILTYVHTQEFWLRMMGANILFFEKNREALDLHLATQRGLSMDFDRDDDGHVMRGPNSAETSPEREFRIKEDSRLIKEHTLFEVLKWKISAGDDMDTINKFCKAVQTRYDIRRMQIYEILLKVEYRLLERCRPIPLAQREKSRYHNIGEVGPLAKVFDFLDVKSALEFTLVNKEYRNLYKLPFLRNVLIRGVFPQETRLIIWSLLLSPVEFFN